MFPMHTEQSIVVNTNTIEIHANTRIYLISIQTKRDGRRPSVFFSSEYSLSLFVTYEVEKQNKIQSK